MFIEHECDMVRADFQDSRCSSEPIIAINYDHFELGSFVVFGNRPSKSTAMSSAR